MYDADSEDLSIKELEYDKLLNPKPKGQTDKADTDAVIATTEVEVKKEGELMNLKFKDLESYDDIMRDYENTNSPSGAAADVVIKKESGVLSKLAGWF